MMPPKPHPSVCLNMIVKNERQVLPRCLASVKELVSHWAIIDTGSVDGTQALVRELLHDVPGELVERPWVSFDQNRTEALALAHGRAEWLLLLDADEELMFDEGFAWPTLSADAYQVTVKSGDVCFERLLIVRNTGDWVYRGVLHEHLASSQAKRIGQLRGVTLVAHPDGARSADPHRDKRDALLLEGALLDEPDNSRHVFYLGQSYKSAGEHQRALAAFRRRAQMGGDPEEAWYALYQVGLMQLVLGEPWPGVLATLLEAYGRWPERAEPLHVLAAECQRRGAPGLAAFFLREAVRVHCPDRGLFVERSVYAYRLPFQAAVSHAANGAHGEAVRLFNQVLRTPGVAPDIFEQALLQRRLSVAAYPRTPQAQQPAARAPRLVVCVPFRDPGHGFDNCIDRLLAQRDADFRMVFFDNASGDDSARRVPEDDPRVTLVRALHPLEPAEIVDFFLTTHCEPDEIFVYLDGRDWLAHERALARVAGLYASGGCQVVYGQYRDSSGRLGRAEPYPDAMSFIELEHAHFPHLLITFRAGLYRELPAGSLRTAQGGWAHFAWDDDRALMGPLLRLAGFDRVLFNDEALYVLDTDGPRRSTCRT